MIFENDPAAQSLLRKYTQEDMLASFIRVGLSAAGPIGAVASEFLTQFVPQQRLDRLHDFIEKLNERIADLEGQFQERLHSSPGYAALAEQASVSAVQTASDEHRKDLAELLKHGLSRPDAEMLEEQALLSLRNRVNDAEVVLLMSYGNFSRTMGDTELHQFQQEHPGLFNVHPPTQTSSAEERRRWTMREHYEGELAALGLLRDTEGIAKSGQRRKYQITSLGKLLLEAIGRYRDPHRSSGPQGVGGRPG